MYRKKYNYSKNNNNHCPDCGKLICNVSNRCSSCATKRNYKLGFGQGFKKGHTIQQKWIEKNRLAHLGKKQSKEIIEKRVRKLRGRKKPPHTELTKRKISERKQGTIAWNKNRHYTKEQYDNIFTEERKKKMSKRMKGKNHPNWKGGRSSLLRRLRNSYMFKEWREFVFNRDNFICQECGLISGNGKAIILQPHHIKSFTKFPDLRFNTYNGITLCKDCHNKTIGKEEQFEKHFQNKLLIEISGGAQFGFSRHAPRL